jgi:hypothetical protein
MLGKLNAGENGRENASENVGKCWEMPEKIPGKRAWKSGWGLQDGGR